MKFHCGVQLTDILVAIGDTSKTMYVCFSLIPILMYLEYFYYIPIRFEVNVVCFMWLPFRCRYVTK